MRKRILCLISIFILLMPALAGCGKEEATKVEKEPAASPVPVKETFSVQDVAKAPEGFNLVALFQDGQRLLGIAGDKLVVFNAVTGEKKTLTDSAWEAALSPDNQWVAFTNEEGISIISVDGEERASVGTIGEGADGSVGDILWSPDSKQLLVVYNYEWNSESYIVGMRDMKVSYLPLGEKGKFLTFPVSWLDEDTILLQKHWPKPKAGGEGQYTEAGYRSDLVSIKTDGSQWTPLTDSEDGQYFIFEGLTRDRQTVLATLTDSKFQNRQAGILKIEEKSFKALTAHGNHVAPALSADGKWVVYSTLDSSLPGYKICRVPAAGGEERILATRKGSRTPGLFIGAPDGERFYFIEWDETQRASLKMLTKTEG